MYFAKLRVSGTLFIIFVLVSRKTVSHMTPRWFIFPVFFRFIVEIADASKKNCYTEIQMLLPNIFLESYLLKKVFWLFVKFSKKVRFPHTFHWYENVLTNLWTFGTVFTLSYWWENELASFENLKRKESNYPSSTPTFINSNSPNLLKTKWIVQIVYVFI